MLRRPVEFTAWLREHRLPVDLEGPFSSALQYIEPGQESIWREQLWSAPVYLEMRLAMESELQVFRKAPQTAAENADIPRVNDVDANTFMAAVQRGFRDVQSARRVAPIEAHPHTETRSDFVKRAKDHYNARRAALESRGWPTASTGGRKPELDLHAEWFLRHHANNESIEEVAPRQLQMESVRLAILRFAQRLGA